MILLLSDFAFVPDQPLPAGMSPTTDHEPTEGRSVIGSLRKYPTKEVREEAQALGKIAGPLVISTLLILLRSLVSMIFLGRLGKLELAGGSLALGFWNVTGNSVLKGLAMRMDPICSQAFGAKNWSLLTLTFSRTIALLLLVSIPITILWLNAESLLLRLGQDPEVARYAGVFMATYVPELFAQSFLQPLRALLRTQGLTMPVTLASLIALILHVPINYFLVIYMGLGIRGVALGLALNTMNLDLGLLIYIYTSKSPIKPWEHGYGVSFLSIFQDLQQLVAFAGPSCLSICSEWWWYNIMLVLCSRVGDSPESSIAAMGIMIQICSYLYCIPFSLNSAALARVGNALGAGRPCRAKLISIVGLVASVAFGASVFAFATAARSKLARIYTDEPTVIDLVTSTLPILGLCELGNAPRTVASGVLMGTARPELVARANLCSFYVIGLPLTLLLAFKFEYGFKGLWLGLLASEISGTFMISYDLRRTDWKYQAKRAEKLTLISGEKSD
ncbi:hypothetical protein CDL15_Pgr000512 [Punica granatum]|uniref:Protein DETOXIFICATION n=1 Tax=Punica granatum TaxID=22663 RepID=A0A218W422_PUNGR|nr:hypothetical protein CDL15_Pgr000512 [Punica granatum]PKI38006.1 hypothetical protein CRG98_041602 [Punica granatum]